ncbi:hypothetical protein HY404_04200 [Candidatus Microgenomates bacterium]|nr:hypothetical protein [Candidatus Microgenomates bacterium]
MSLRSVILIWVATWVVGTAMVGTVFFLTNPIVTGWFVVFLLFLILAADQIVKIRRHRHSVRR